MSTIEEKRAYQRGYQAGIKRNKRERAVNVEQNRHAAFWNACFLAVLPAAMNTDGWKFGEKPIATTEDRIRLAVVWAEQASKKRKALV